MSVETPAPASSSSSSSSGNVPVAKDCGTGGDGPLKAGGSSQEPRASEESGSSCPRGSTAQEASHFDCNICLEVAREPVVTLCGHLYCWPCLYRWLHTDKACKECPVCKAGVQEASVVPLYGRGQTNPKDPRKHPPEGIPHRPAGQRPPSQRDELPNFGFNFTPPGPFATAQIGNLTFSAGIGLFPSLFGLQLQTANGLAGIDPTGAMGPRPAPNNSEPPTLEQQQREFLSKLFLVVGSFVILCLIYF